MTTNYKENLLNTRERSHGKFNEMSLTAQALKADMRSSKHWNALNWETKEALDNIMTKIARIIDGDETNPEHTRDIKGYADLIEHWAKVPAEKHGAKLNSLDQFIERVKIDPPYFAPEPDDYLTFWNGEECRPAYITESEYKLLKNNREAIVVGSGFGKEGF